MSKRFFINFDKAGAEWVVVAYLSGDANMISVVESGESPHVVTAHLATGIPKELIIKEHKLLGEMNDPMKIEALRERHLPELLKYDWLPRGFALRQTFKKANHGLNYKEDWFKFMMDNELEAAESKRICHSYRGSMRGEYYSGPIAYPNISVWWNSIEEELRSNRRTLHNLLEHKREFPGMWGDDLIKSAISYKPQSTIGRMVRIGETLAYKAMVENRPYFDLADLNANVHDSLLFSYEWGKWFSCAHFALAIDKMMSPQLECKGRTFKIKTDIKVGGRNWSKMVEVKPSKDINTLARNIKQAALLSEQVDVKKAA